MKIVPQITPAQAAALIKSGDTLLVGGFGMTGNPVHLVHALAETDVKVRSAVGRAVKTGPRPPGRVIP